MAGLTNRVAERGTLDQLVGAVRAGHGQALVLRGDPGMGKTVLLDYLAGRADGCRVVRVTGVPSETELPFAGLHQVCVPLLDQAERLPAPQRDALRTAFGVSPGPRCDPFFLGLAVLSLLSEDARERPLIGLVDDVQWLDRASAQALGFVARRLAGQPVGLVFAAREPSAELAGLPGLALTGLPEAEARDLLASALAGPLDARVRDLIIAETRGNPLALLALPRGLNPAELAGGFGLPGAAGLAGQAGDGIQRQLQGLPEQTRRLLRLASADPSGDRSLVWRAAGRLGIPMQAGAPAVEAGLVEFGGQVRFRHPLARSAVYQSSPLPDRQRMHAALAEVTDPRADPDRRAWHRAQAAAGPDEDVAAALEGSAGRAQARGGLAAAAAFLERSVWLTPDPARHAGRVLAAGRASLRAGAFGTAREMVSTLEAAPLDAAERAQLELLGAEVAFAAAPGGHAGRLLLDAARRLEPLDPALAREVYLQAWGAASLAGRAGARLLLEVSRAALARPDAPQAQGAAAPEASGPAGLLLAGLARLVTAGPDAAAPLLRRAVRACADGDAPVDGLLRWGWLPAAAADALWDDDGQRAVAGRQLRLIREAGALDQLPVYLDAAATAAARSGDLDAAQAHIAEARAVADATGTSVAAVAPLLVAALRGHTADGTARTGAATAAGQGSVVAAGHWAEAIRANGLGRYAEAMTAARRAGDEAPGDWLGTRALPELVEAAARAGQAELAADALRRLARAVTAGQADSGLGVTARCRALLSPGPGAEACYREATQRLGRTRLRPELARAHLLYGEWLRREGRRADAREQLRAAHGQFTSIGMAAFAERARRELAATGGKALARGTGAGVALTEQEASIARLARDGSTNPEIGAQLFLSARTVEWHLRKVFTKLGIGSRRDLPGALSRLGRDGRVPPPGRPAGGIR